MSECACIYCLETELYSKFYCQYCFDGCAKSEEDNH